MIPPALGCTSLLRVHRVWALGFIGFRVQGLWRLGFQGLGFRVQGLGFGVEASGFRF